MKDVRIKPWPFAKGELVELFWLCSPYLDPENNWVFKASFKDSANKSRDIKLPWGILPDLCIGQYFIDGLPSEFPNRGYIEEVDVSKVTEYEICDAFDMPAALYYFNQNPLLGKQKVCKFRVNNRIYYAPCVEIVRSFLAPSRVLAYQLLRPNGLDVLFEKVTYNAELCTVYVDLSRDYPQNLVNEDNIIHLIWLKTNKQIRAVWNSVYSNIYKKAIEISPSNPTQGFKAGIPFEVKPLSLPFGRWTFRGISVNNYALILEIKEIKGLPMKLGYISYTHPNFSKPEKFDEPKILRATGDNGEKEEKTLEIKQDDAKKNYSMLVASSTKVKFEFMHKPKIKRIVFNTHKQRIGEPDGKNITLQGGSDNCGEKQSIITGSDWTYEGKTDALEFKIIEVTYSSSTDGLEEFLKAIGAIQEINRNLIITTSIIILPEDKSFSYYENGQRRNCAIVKVEQDEMLICHIIEIGRADGWAISTLFIKQIALESSDEEYEKLFWRLISGMVNNNGHWDMLSINKERGYHFEMSKHIGGQFVERWAERIYKRI